MSSRPRRVSIEELELLTPQELADLLAQIVLVLRRLPSVPLVELSRAELEPLPTDPSSRVDSHVPG